MVVLQTICNVDGLDQQQEVPCYIPRSKNKVVHGSTWDGGFPSLGFLQ